MESPFGAGHGVLCVPPLLGQLRNDLGVALATADRCLGLGSQQPRLGLIILQADEQISCRDAIVHANEDLGDLAG